jgi:hypothetical protein
MNTKELIIDSPTHGKFTVLYDAEDHDKVSTYRWHVNKDNKKNKDKFYVVSHYCSDSEWVKRSDHPSLRRKRHTISIHRLVMDAPKGMYVDHINGNALDNRKSNLRLCTNAQNCRNTGPYLNNKSGYRGVCWHKRDKQWRAQIKHNGKVIWIGGYQDKEEAARAYDNKALELQGEFANLNFPKDKK